jgi:hypothetical protein
MLMAFFMFAKLWKFTTKKNMLVGERGVIQLFNAFTKLCYFYFSKGNECIYIYLIIFANLKRQQHQQRTFLKEEKSNFVKFKIYVINVL